MTPQEWNAALSKANGWEIAYPVVEREARAFLEETTLTHTTSELVEHLFPERFARQSEAGQMARKRIYKALLAEKNPWRDRYAFRGPARFSGPNRGSAPWHWTNPIRKAAAELDSRALTKNFNTVCPECGQEIF